MASEKIGFSDVYEKAESTEIGDLSFVVLRDPLGHDALSIVEKMLYILYGTKVALYHERVQARSHQGPVVQRLEVQIGVLASLLDDLGQHDAVSAVNIKFSVDMYKEQKRRR